MSTNTTTPAIIMDAFLHFEPTSTSGVRITARDKEGMILWGFVANQYSIKDHHQLVAIYPELQRSCIDNFYPESKQDAPSDEQLLTSLQEAIQLIQVMKNNITNPKNKKLKTPRNRAVNFLELLTLTSLSRSDSGNWQGSLFA